MSPFEGGENKMGNPFNGRLWHSIIRKKNRSSIKFMGTQATHPGNLLWMLTLPEFSCLACLWSTFEHPQLLYHVFPGMRLPWFYSIMWLFQSFFFEVKMAKTSCMKGTTCQSCIDNACCIWVTGSCHIDESLAQDLQIFCPARRTTV